MPVLAYISFTIINHVQASSFELSNDCIADKLPAAAAALENLELTCPYIYCPYNSPYSCNCSYPVHLSMSLCLTLSMLLSISLCLALSVTLALPLPSPVGKAVSSLAMPLYSYNRTGSGTLPLR